MKSNTVHTLYRQLRDFKWSAGVEFQTVLLNPGHPLGFPMQMSKSELYHLVRDNKQYVPHRKYCSVALIWIVTHWFIAWKQDATSCTILHATFFTHRGLTVQQYKDDLFYWQCHLFMYILDAGWLYSLSLSTEVRRSLSVFSFR